MTETQPTNCNTNEGNTNEGNTDQGNTDEDIHVAAKKRLIPLMRPSTEDAIKHAQKTTNQT